MVSKTSPSLEQVRKKDEVKSVGSRQRKKKMEHNRGSATTSEKLQTLESESSRTQFKLVRSWGSTPSSHNLNTSPTREKVTPTRLQSHRFSPAQSKKNKQNDPKESHIKLSCAIKNKRHGTFSELHNVGSTSGKEPGSLKPPTQPIAKKKPSKIPRKAHRDNGGLGVWERGAPPGQKRKT